MSSVTNSKSRPCVDHDTDHILVEAKVRLKMYRSQTKKMSVKHDIEKLDDDKIRTEYTVAIENKFEILLQTANDDSTPDELLNSIKNVFLESADEILGKKKNKKTKPWISEEAIKLSVKKREARLKNDRVEYVRLRAEIQKK